MTATTPRSFSSSPAPPPAPLRPRSAYLYFSLDFFPIFRQRLPTAKIGVLAKAVGAAWREASASERAVYEERARADSERWRKEKAAYESALPPRRPTSAYLFFVRRSRESVRRAHPDLSFGELSTLLSQQWRRLPDAERAEFYRLAAQDQQRYREDLRKRGPPRIKAK
eukprot:CAMPEP_0170745208 /NCGR_PEP_ID=MMETSP0437-20130122/8177_1 /TAXON_ID=0 /ORGANISM="Sexangularia sp." /LENGTH=167 /DNA_ID=CAMNT_0011083925 /DNA_START=320 /DNA_END=823 /DNA_ORIENTATION=+